MIDAYAAGLWLHHMAEALRTVGIPGPESSEILRSLGPLAQYMTNAGENVPRTPLNDANSPSKRSDCSVLALARFKKPSTEGENRRSGINWVINYRARACLGRSTIITPIVIDDRLQRRVERLRTSRTSELRGQPR